MRILFAGSPAIAIPALESVAAVGEGGSSTEMVLAGLLTNPDSPKGRSSRLEPTECASAAAALEQPVPILKPEKLDCIAREQVAALKPDLLVSFAYGKIFGPQFLALFPLGGINIHPSLLPQYRGPTPIPAAIINRDTETGITIQRLAAEMDAGDILAQETVPLNGRETTVSLSEIMAKKAALLLPELLKKVSITDSRPQDHSAASYCSLIAKEDGLIDWGLSAADIDARIRAFDPWPLSWTVHGELPLCILKAEVFDNAGNGAAKAACPNLPGQVLGKDKDKGILIQTGDGILAVRELQYRAKKALDWKAFLNGTASTTGARNFLEARLG